MREIPKSTGAEDFAFYAQAAPTLFLYVGSTPVGQEPLDAPPNHSPRYFLDEGALQVGVRTLLRLALDYGRDPSRPAPSPAPAAPSPGAAR